MGFRQNSCRITKVFVAIHPTILSASKVSARKLQHYSSKNLAVSRRCIKNSRQNLVILFSKMLGTINRNVPMKFSLPGQTWKEGLEPKELLELFNELEFRSLSLRLKTFFASLGKSTDVLNGVLYPEDVAATPALPALSAEEKREMSVMISLVDSAENRASTEDILQFTKATTFKEAKEKLLKDLAKKELMVV